MIIVKLTGGLGNQLFQYAMGYTIAAKNKTQLKLDLSFFEHYEWHTYSLAPFNIPQNFATTDETAINKQVPQGLLGKVKKKLSLVSNGHIAEKDLTYDPVYTAIKNNSYLEGYWQCEKYFATQENSIREKFKIIIPPSLPNRALLDKIYQTEAISLHIRRGNYVNVDAVNKVHGTCSMNYYYSAVKLMTDKYPSAVFYIFSDDIAWAKANLLIDFECVFVDINNDETDYEDLRLMQNCKHHIIANSTFSWWGAWLNPNPNKTVIAPQIWFADREKNKEAETIIPVNWIRL